MKGKMHKEHMMKDMKPKRAKGGAVQDAKSEDFGPEMPSEVYSGGGSNVAKEARERKRGGRVEHMKEHKADGGKVEGMEAKKRCDRPARKSGGRVGSDQNPYSSAAKVAGGREERP